MESRLQKGTRVKTTKHAGSTDWSDPYRADAKWGVEGIIIGHSDSHGLIYKVQHDCGGTAWYEPNEIELCIGYSEPCKVDRSTANLSCKLSDLSKKDKQ